MRGESADEQFWGISDVSKRFDIPKGMIHKLWRRKGFPSPVAIGPKIFRWKESDLCRWKRPVDPLSKSLIYFVRGGDFVKIGFTRKIDRRIIAIQTGCPVKVELLLTFPGTTLDEKSLHRRFAAYHSNGEWFAYKGELAEFIEGHF